MQSLTRLHRVPIGSHAGLAYSLAGPAVMLPGAFTLRLRDA